MATKFYKKEVKVILSPYFIKQIYANILLKNCSMEIQRKIVGYKAPAQTVSNISNIITK